MTESVTNLNDENESMENLEENKTNSALDMDTSKSKRISHEKRGSKEIDGNNLPLDPVLEVNENDSQVLIEDEFVEISPRVFSKKEIPDPLTNATLDNVIYELGVVNLCWPVIKDPVFETRTCFPTSYYTNSKKEKLLLSYTENFRRQFLFHYPMRKPLLLQALNECGLMKMVCTTIRPTKLCFADTVDYKGIASLVSDFFDYEPLTKSMLHPERIMSPYSVIVRRSGNSFELAHILVSWLAGAHYDAYVVVGSASRDTCLNIRYRTNCPDVPDEHEEPEEVEEPEEEPRYRLVPLPDLTSKYCKDMEKKEIDKEQAEKDKIEAERQKKIEELERPPADEIDGWRTHAWVLVLPGFQGVEEPFFIEPSQGNIYPLDCKIYQCIDSVYNHENYYANVQKCNEGLETISYDLCDMSCWEHLLAGEPYYRRNFVGVDVTDRRTAVETEKHLDMPASWVERLDITADEYEQRYPGSHKVIHYKKVLLEKFSRYSQPTGIVKRVKIFEDYALLIPLLTYEWYDNRTDFMLTAKIDHVNKLVKETFQIGRKEHLIKHEYSLDAPPNSVEADRTLTFNYYARLDHLTRVECTATTFHEYYTDREDKLECRKIVYSKPMKKERNDKERERKKNRKEKIQRNVLTITEIFSRNYNKLAKDDIWRKKFLIPEKVIQLVYHYEYNFVTTNNRSFIKPNLAETGGKILFYPEKTKGYIADPNAEWPRDLDVYYTLCENMVAERLTEKHIRDRETDVIGYLMDRYKEITEPTLYVSLFDTERNEAAKKSWREQEAQKAEITERETEAAIDPLAPYLARLFGSGHGSGSPLSVKDATLVREQCINDFKNKQMARQLLVQERFDKLNTEYKNKRLWYLANQFVLTPQKESAYFTLSAELAFQVHTLEVRLTRHRDLSGPRYQVLDEYLRKHPLMIELIKAKYYRH